MQENEQYPGFIITCKNCESTNVEVDDSCGWSAQSGGWGSLDLVCTNCNKRTTLKEMY